MKYIKKYENNNNDYSKYILYYPDTYKSMPHIFEIIDVINSGGEKKYKIKYITSYFNDSGFDKHILYDNTELEYPDEGMKKVMVVHDDDLEKLKKETIII